MSDPFFGVSIRWVMQICSPRDDKPFYEMARSCLYYVAGLVPFLDRHNRYIDKLSQVVSSALISKKKEPVVSM